MQLAISALVKKSHDNSDEVRKRGMQSSAFLGSVRWALRGVKIKIKVSCHCMGCSPDPQPDSMNAIMSCARWYALPLHATRRCDLLSIEIRDDAHTRTIPIHTHKHIHASCSERGAGAGNSRREPRLPHLTPWALCALAGPLHQDKPYKNIPSPRLLARLIKLHKDGRYA